MKIIKSVTVVIFLALIIAACKQSEPEITISGVWSRPVELPGSNSSEKTNGHADKGAACCAAEETAKKPACCASDVNGVVYLEIKNTGGRPDRLLGAKSNIARVVELHESKMEQGRMSMQKVEAGIEIPGGDKVELKPGGYHIMLIGLKQSLKTDDAFSVELDFEQSPDTTVTSTVKLF